MAVLIAARCLVIVLFGSAVAGKLAGSRRWAAFVAGTGALVPLRRGVTALAAGTVLVEATAAGLAVRPDTARAGLLLAAGLLGTFAGAIVVAHRRGVRTRCRCFGGDGAPLGPGHAIRNAVVAVALVVVALPATGPATSAATVLGVALGALAGALLVLADHLADLFGGATRVTRSGTP